MGEVGTLCLNTFLIVAIEMNLMEKSKLLKVHFILHGVFSSGSPQNFLNTKSLYKLWHLQRNSGPVNMGYCT